MDRAAERVAHRRIGEGSLAGHRTAVPTRPHPIQVGGSGEHNTELARGHTFSRRYSGDGFSRLRNPLIYQHLMVEAAGIEPLDGHLSKPVMPCDLRLKGLRTADLLPPIESTGAYVSMQELTPVDGDMSGGGGKGYPRPRPAHINQMTCG